MGQKTEFILEDWDFPEEESEVTDFSKKYSDSDFLLDSDEMTGFDEAFSLLEQEPSEPSEASTGQSDEQESSSAAENNRSDEVKIVINNPQTDSQSLFEVHGNKIHINDNDQDTLTQEEEAFRKQIQDLFELLEMEKAADKSDGIRVYQTDSSPSKPWRFH